MKPWVGYLAAGTIGIGVTSFVGEGAINNNYEPKNKMLTDCQLDIVLDNVLTGECANAVIDLAARDIQLGVTVHTSPELEEMGAVKSPGRLAILAGDNREALIDELEKQKTDIRGQRIGNMIFGGLYGLTGFFIYRIYKKAKGSTNPEPPPKSKKDLPEDEAPVLRLVA